MNELEVINKIEDKIYEIRGRQVMLDSDLAELYHCKNGTKSINLAVKRNINKFPKDFMFQLTKDELNGLPLRFQFETLNNSDNMRGQHYKYFPNAFTEQGVAMLATVIHTEVAASVSIDIMRAFVAMRKYISSNLIEQKYINELVIKNDSRLTLVENTLDSMNKKEKVNTIYFEGQIYDAYSKIVDIMNIAKEELVIIDSYADKTVLDMISKINCKVILICKKKSLLKQIDIDKYNKQYKNLVIIYNDNFHDRYFLIDKKILYHCGASINHAGSKTFSINKIEDNFIINSIVNKITKIIDK